VTRTKHPATGTLRGATVDVPKGTSCTPASHGEYFVDRWDFLDPYFHFDAEHYGIRISGDHVEHR
jgi:hypothetical protein